MCGRPLFMVIHVIWRWRVEYVSA